MQPHADPVMAMDLSPSGDHIISAGGDSTISRSCFDVISAAGAVHAVIDDSPLSTSTCNMKTPQTSSSWARPTVAEEKASLLEMKGTASDLLSLNLSRKDAVQLPVKGEIKHFLPFFLSLLLRLLFRVDPSSFVSTIIPHYKDL